MLGPVGEGSGEGVRQPFKATLTPVLSQGGNEQEVA